MVSPIGRQSVLRAPDREPSLRSRTHASLERAPRPETVAKSITRGCTPSFR
jgi:hypothetical protein